MGLTRKTMSLFTMGAVDFRSDKERTAAYTRGIRRQSRKQTQILKQAQIQQAVDDLHLKAAQREARRIVLAETRGQSKIPKQQSGTQASGPTSAIGADWSKDLRRAQRAARRKNK